MAQAIMQLNQFPAPLLGAIARRFVLVQSQATQIPQPRPYPRHLVILRNFGCASYQYIHCN
jgi:hypothetical protein